MSGTVLIGPESFLGRELLDRLRSSRVSTEDLTLVEPASDAVVLASFGGGLRVATPLLEDAVLDAGLVIVCEALSEERAALVKASARVVLDLTGTLEGRPVDAGSGARVADLPAGVHASPSGAALLLASLVRGARSAGAKGRAVATVLEPASELGTEALDELHGQAVALLNFAPLPTEVLGRQLVHDVVAPAPHAAVREGRLRHELSGLLGDRRRVPSLFFLQAGIFHGVAVACWSSVDATAWREALETDANLEVVGEDVAVSPVVSVGRPSAVVGSIVADDAGGAWAWAASDSLAHGSVGNASRVLGGE